MTKYRLPTRARLALGAVLFVLVVVVVGALLTEPQHANEGLATNPNLDPGTAMSRVAPAFTLRDEFGRPVSLSSYRGRVVILAFNDSQCTTVCPLTTTAMLDAKAMLGSAGSRVQLLGIDANPTATAVSDVRAYSQVHGMLHAWHFLTGSLGQLRRVWSEYGIAVQIEAGQIDHTPALYVIDTQGVMRKVYLTQMSYASVPQLGQLLAQEAARLLPGGPRVQAKLSYQQVPAVAPSDHVVLPRAGGGSVQLDPPRAPQLLLFFDTWDSEVTNLAGHLEALKRYAAAAPAAGLPALTAVDEASVEPSAGALPRFLAGLPSPLSYPVAIDGSGRVADGYGVQDEPWLALVSASDQIVWYYDVSTSGWLKPAALDQDIRAALARTSGEAPSAAAAQRELTDSPAPLAALHGQAGRLLGSQPALTARLRALRGYPVVVNAWASWCGPCRSEFGLLGYAAAHYGRQVAFLGADTADSSGDARSFLAAHPVSYPSYQTTISGLGPIASIEGLPTTIFINRAGKVAYVHTGQYVSQGTLDQDIQSHAL